MKSFLSVHLCMLTVITAAMLPPPLSAQVDESIDKYIEKRMQTERIPAISIAYIDSGGTLTYHSYGCTDADCKMPADENTLYEIGSVTKTFTGLLLSILREKMDFDLDIPVSELSGGRIRLPSGHDTEITFRHMVTHVSGLQRMPGNLSPASMDDPYVDYTYEQLYEFLDNYRPAVAPGERFEYSNLVYMVLGNLAEVLGGADFDELVREYITGELQMSATTRLVTDSTRFATPTLYGLPVKYWNMDHVRGVGELRSSAADMARYLKAYLGHTSYPYNTAAKAAYEPLYDRRENAHIGYAWMISTAHSDTVVFHGGGTGGFRAFAGFSPVNGTGVVVLSNSTDDIEDIGLHLLNHTYKLKEVPEVWAVDETALDRLAGYYVSEGMPGFRIFSNQNALFGQMDGQQALPLIAVSDTVFRNAMVQAEIRFPPVGDAAAHMTLHQMGNEIRYERSERGPVERKEIELTEEQLQEYTGHYLTETGLAFEFTVPAGRLHAQLTNQPAFQVFAYDTDSFFYKVVTADLKFRRAEDGRVDAVTLYQGGQQILFMRQN